MKHVHKCLKALPFIVVAAGCAGIDDSEVGPVVRDSSGVVIVENPWTDYKDAQLRIGDRPVLEIGQADGEGVEVFGRIAHATRLRTGEIVVADAMALELRIFDSEGSHVSTVGGQGQGPGEFSSLWWTAELSPDSILAVDNLNGRISVFLDTAFIRSYQLPRVPGAAAPNVVGMLGDGTLVVSALAVPPARTDRTRSMVTLYTVDRDGRLSRTIGEFFHHELGRNGLGLGFGGESVFAVEDSLIWIGQTSRFDLHAVNRNGSIRRIVRLGGEPRAVSEDDIARAQSTVEASLARQGVSGPVAQRILNTEFSATYPVHGRVMVDENAHLWVAGARTELIDEGPDVRVEEWDVFDADGRRIATLAMPMGFRATHIGGEHVLGIHTDGVGVERVQVYWLERNGPRVPD